MQPSTLIAPAKRRPDIGNGCYTRRSVFEGRPRRRFIGRNKARCLGRWFFTPDFLDREPESHWRDNPLTPRFGFSSSSVRNEQRNINRYFITGSKTATFLRARAREIIKKFKIRRAKERRKALIEKQRTERIEFEKELQENQPPPVLLLGDKIDVESLTVFEINLREMAEIFDIE